MPHMQVATPAHNARTGSHRVALKGRFHMTGTHADAHANETGAERQRANPGQRLGQGHRGAAAEHAKGLACALVHPHGGHTHVRLGSGVERHAEPG